MSGTKHPRDRGLVLMSVWVEPPLRDYVKVYAERTGQGLADAAAGLLRRSLAAASIKRLLPDGARYVDCDCMSCRPP